MNASEQNSGPAAPRLPRNLERRIKIARGLLLFEALWPALWPAFTLLGIFVAAALLGLIALLPVWLHWLALAALGGGLVGVLWKGLREFRFPDRRDALRLIEETNGLRHQPLSAIEDLPAGNSGDASLWSAHRLWAGLQLTKLRVGLPQPTASTMDRFGMRAALVLLLAIGILGTPTGQMSRLRDAFLPGLEASRRFNLEAWITPPAYTAKPPLYLERPDMQGKTLRVPEGSILSLRAHGLRSAPELEIAEEGRARPRELRDIGEGNYAIDAPISAASSLVLTQGGRMVRHWEVEIIPDTAPTIAFDKPMATSASGALRFSYNMSDDYGIASAEARMTLVAPPKGTGTPRGRAPAARVTPPRVPLAVSASRGRDGKAETYADLSSHPWAGLAVSITLYAKDDAGQEGQSSPVSFTLPARTFSNPLAAAIIEQRQRLAFDPYAGMGVARFLDVYMQEPERYLPDHVAYLALRSAYWRLRYAERDQDLNGIYDLLWAAALRIEDGDMSLSEKDLRSARAALQDALARGASEEEIGRLLDTLKDAFERYMNALEAKFGPMKSDMSKQSWSANSNKTIERSDLENMMSLIGELARTGAREQAEMMLSQLQNILENLRIPNQNQKANPAENALAEAIEKTGKMIGEQTKLMDESFRHAQPDAKFDKNALAALRKNQEALRQALADLMTMLQEEGVTPPHDLREATKSMSAAEERLGDGRADRAANAQGQAIDRLRKGAQSMADALSQSMAGQAGAETSGKDSDPFGRQLSGSNSDTGSNVHVPDKIDVQRAYEILEELRNRANETGRPQIEIDYLDRLLKRF